MSIVSEIKDCFNIISGKAERDYIRSIGQSNAAECLYFEALGKEKRKKALEALKKLEQKKKFNPIDNRFEILDL